MKPKTQKVSESLVELLGKAMELKIENAELRIENRMLKEQIKLKNT